MRNSEMLKFVPDHLKTKKICKHAVKNLPYPLRYVTDQHKLQIMFDKVILENGGTKIKKFVIKQLIITLMQNLEFIPECYKTHKICDKAVNTYPSTINLFMNAL